MLDIDIQNILGISRAQVRVPDRHHLLVYGPHGAGKTSFCRAVIAACRLDPNPLKVPATAATIYRHNTTKGGQVTVETARGSTTWKLPKALSQVGVPPLLSRFVASQYAVLWNRGMTAKQELWQEVVSLEITVELLEERLKPMCSDPRVRQTIIEDVMKVGWDQAEGAVRERNRAVKREWQDLVANTNGISVTFGTKVAAGWKPEPWQESWRHLDVAEIDADIGVAETELESLRSVRLVSEAEMEKLPGLVAEIDSHDEILSIATKDVEKAEGVVNIQKGSLAATKALIAKHAHVSRMRRDLEDSIPIEELDTDTLEQKLVRVDQQHEREELMMPEMNKNMQSVKARLGIDSRYMDLQLRLKSVNDSKWLKCPKCDSKLWVNQDGDLEGVEQSNITADAQEVKKEKDKILARIKTLELTIQKEMDDDKEKWNKSKALLAERYVQHKDKLIAEDLAQKKNDEEAKQRIAALDDELAKLGDPTKIQNEEEDVAGKLADATKDLHNTITDQGRVIERLRILKAQRKELEESQVGDPASESTIRNRLATLRQKRKMVQAWRKHTECLASVAEYDQILGLLSPQGLRREMREGNFGHITGTLEKLVQILQLMPITLDPETLEIEVNGRPLVVCAGSEAWLADFVVRLAVAHATDQPLMIADDAERYKNDLAELLVRLARIDWLTPTVIVAFPANSGSNTGLPMNVIQARLQEGILNA